MFPLKSLPKNLLGTSPSPFLRGSLSLNPLLRRHFPCFLRYYASKYHLFLSIYMGPFRGEIKHIPVEKFYSHSHLLIPKMEISSMQRQAANMKKNLFDQGYLDEQFYHLEELQDDASPNFVEEVATLFFQDSSRLIANIEQVLEKCPQEFHKLDDYTHQLKGSSSSIGALKMKNQCKLFRDYCLAQNFEGCLKSFQNVKKEHAALRQKLESYFQLLRQVNPAERGKSSRN